MFLTHVYNFKYVFNSTVIKLSWHVFCYLISKNLYSLQNVQPFIFQLICMQLCKCINCFLKTHNKQLNQYCLNFTIFFYPKKKVLKKWFKSGRVGLVRKKTHVRSWVNPFLLRVKNLGLGWIFFRSSQKILTHFAMSRHDKPCVVVHLGQLNVVQRVGSRESRYSFLIKENEEEE